MKILVRRVVGDEEKQAGATAKLLRKAEVIAVSLPCLCEFVWVLRGVYGFAQQEIAAAIDALGQQAIVWSEDGGTAGFTLVSLR